MIVTIFKKNVRVEYMNEELRTKRHFFSEDARITLFHFKKFCLAELCVALFSVIGIALAIVAVIFLHLHLKIKIVILI